jgi:hypothetical protein
MTQVFDTDFLDELERKCNTYSLYEYFMKEKNMTFEESILECARYCEMKPKYWKDDASSG